MPSPSYFPLVAAFGLPVIAYGQIYRVWPVSILGALVLLGGIYAWGFEPSVDPEPDEEEIEAHEAQPALVGAGAPALGGAAAGALGAGAAAEPVESGAAEPVESGAAEPVEVHREAPSGGGQP
jgi:hypothetical protein